MLTRDKNAKLSAVTMALHHGQMRMTCGQAAVFGGSQIKADNKESNHYVIT